VYILVEKPLSLFDRPTCSIKMDFRDVDWEYVIFSTAQFVYNPLSLCLVLQEEKIKYMRL
jgi:hypothetical protein